MATLGMNVRADGLITAESLDNIGATWAVIVARQEYDITSILTDYRYRGVMPLLLLDKTSIAAYGPIDTPHLAATATAAIREYVARYRNLPVAWIIGNEPDHISESSWTMSRQDFQILGKAARQALPGATIICGGLVSGQPSWLDGQDISWFDVLGIHPYGKRPSPDWPSPNWGTGYIGDLIDGYAVHGKPLMVTEIGLSSIEAGEALQAQYVERMCNVLARRTDLIAAQWFCMTDDMVDGYGLYRTDGTAKPAADAFAFATTLAIPVPLPGAEQPKPPKLPETPEAAEMEMWRQAWTAIVPTLDYNETIHGWSIPTAWRANYARWGSPLGPEIPEGGGPTRQAFAGAMVRWTGTTVEEITG